MIKYFILLMMLIIALLLGCQPVIRMRNCTNQDCNLLILKAFHRLLAFYQLQEITKNLEKWF